MVRWTDAGPHGNLITANTDAVNVDPNQLSELVEFTPHGKFVSEFSVDPVDAGSAFGLAFGVIDGKESLVAVDDFNSVLDIWTIPVPIRGKTVEDNAAGMHSKPQTIAATDAVYARFSSRNSGLTPHLELPQFESLFPDDAIFV